MTASCRRMMVRAAGALAVVAMSATAQAQSVESFYKDKQIRFVVGAAAGGDYDLGTRLLGRHIGRYIPGNPTIIVQNMTGAGSIRAVNYVFNAAPKDGTVIAAFSRNIPSQAALGQQNVRVDPRQMGWIGATSMPNRICAVLGNSPIRTIDQLYTTELIVGSTGVGSAYSIVPTVINDVLKTKFKIIEGYKGLADILVAMERGEVGGVCQTLNQFQSTYADRLAKGEVRILFNVEEEPVASLPGVPTIFPQLKTEADRQLFRFVFDSTAVFGRPYAFAPGVPADRVQALRTAFLAALKDPALLAEAKQQNLDMDYRTAEQLEKLVGQLYASTPEVLKKAGEILMRQ